MKFNKGQQVVVSSFASHNKGGGTILSEDIPNLKMPIQLTVIHSFCDYETGLKGWGIVSDCVKEDAETTEVFNVLSGHLNGFQETLQRIIEFTKKYGIQNEESEERMKEYEEIVEWGKNTVACKNNFIVFFSEFNVITVE